MIYLDNAATTFPKPECVYDKVNTIQRTIAVNVGRGGYIKSLTKSSSLMKRNMKKSSGFVELLGDFTFFSVCANQMTM